MPAPDPTHPKFNALLQAGKTLFWKHGVKRVSVQEICRAAGTSKVTFYRFFENKVALAKHLLGEIMDASWAHYQATMQSDLPFAERLEQLILRKFQNVQDISAELITDLHVNESLGLKAFLEERTVGMLSTFLDDLQAAQAAGALRADVSRAFMEYQLNHLQQMALDPDLLAQYEHPQDLILEITRYFIYGLLPQDPGASAHP